MTRQLITLKLIFFALMGIIDIPKVQGEEGPEMFVRGNFLYVSKNSPLYPLTVNEEESEVAAGEGSELLTSIDNEKVSCSSCQNEVDKAFEGLSGVTHLLSALGDAGSGLKLSCSHQYCSNCAQFINYVGESPSCLHENCQGVVKSLSEFRVLDLSKKLPDDYLLKISSLDLSKVKIHQDNLSKLELEQVTLSDEDYKGYLKSKHRQDKEVIHKVSPASPSPQFLQDVFTELGIPLPPSFHVSQAMQSENPSKFLKPFLKTISDSGTARKWLPILNDRRLRNLPKSEKLLLRKIYPLLSEEERNSISKLDSKGGERLAVGAFHSCAINKEREVVCWGWNGVGQSTVPADLGKVQSIAIGGYHSCAIKENGKVACWGRNEYGQSTVPEGLGKVQLIALGGNHSCAVKENGEVVCWGASRDGQSTVPADLGKVQSIAAGGNHSCAIKENGEVVCWGWNADGQSTVPADLGKVQSIASGRYHSCAIKENGKVACWGSNFDGQSTVPADLGKVQSIAAGGDHSCAIKENGKVACWGWNTDGQSTVPADLGKVQSIAAGGDHSCAIKENGKVACWGSNIKGQSTVPVGLGKVL